MTADEPMSTPDSGGLRLIAEERRRQVEVEGYSRQHDYAHGSPVLSRAARCYEVPQNMPGVPDAWPWEPESWKPKGLIRNLVRAGALYLAALDAAPPLGQDRFRAKEGLDRCVAALDEITALAAHPTPVPTPDSADDATVGESHLGPHAGCDTRHPHTHAALATADSDDEKPWFRDELAKARAFNESLPPHARLVVSRPVTPKENAMTDPTQNARPQNTCPIDGTQWAVNPDAPTTCPTEQLHAAHDDFRALACEVLALAEADYAHGTDCNLHAGCVCWKRAVEEILHDLPTIPSASRAEDVEATRLAKGQCIGCGSNEPDGPVDSTGAKWCRACADEAQ